LVLCNRDKVPNNSNKSHRVLIICVIPFTPNQFPDSDTVFGHISYFLSLYKQNIKYLTCHLITSLIVFTHRLPWGMWTLRIAPQTLKNSLTSASLASNGMLPTNTVFSLFCSSVFAVKISGFASLSYSNFLAKRCFFVST
jgi:hypothetical protein